MRDRRRKSAPDRVFVEGPRPIEAALAAEATLQHLFHTRSFAVRPEGRALLRRAERAAPPVRNEPEGRESAPSVCTEVSDKVMSQLSGTATPQGVVAVVRLAQTALEGLPLSPIPLIIVCDGIQDPGNLGAIIRTADAAGSDAVVILPDTCDPFGCKTVRSTAGSIFNVPVIPCTADELIRYVAARGIALYVTDSHASSSLYEAVLTGPAAFAFGSETHGPSTEIRSAAQGALRVPIYGRAESLNVAAAAAVCVYETVRQRKTSKPAIVISEK